MSTAAQRRADAFSLLGCGHWLEARDALAEVAAGTGDPEVHEGVAQAAWWLDDAATSLDAREAAYRAYRDVGDDVGAARAATSLGYDAMLFGRGVAVGRGWLSRAAELLEGRTEGPEPGWLAVREAEVALNVDHDAAAGLAAAVRAGEIGRAAGGGDLPVVARAIEGLARTRLGEVDDGMPMLDAAAAAATAGDVEDLMWVGKICCWLISACHDVNDLARAEDWCARVEQICLQRDLAPLFAVCRTQYATVQIARGDLEGAESTLVDVLDRLAGSHRLSRLEAVAQLGELRRRQGRFVEAQSLLQQAGYGPVARASLARLRLDEGDAPRAWAVVDELLRSLPSEPPLERVDVLAAAVAAGVGAGHLEPARTAADELARIAEAVGIDAVSAQASAAAARLAGATTAVDRWRDAVRLFSLAGLGFDEAECRLDLADALVAGGDRPGAREQATLALRTLRPLRSGHAYERARALAATPDGSGPLTDRQTDVLRLLARGHTNVEIAAGLHLSEHTVHRHVANIYTALDVGSRAAAAAYAAGHGLV